MCPWGGKAGRLSALTRFLVFYEHAMRRYPRECQVGKATHFLVRTLKPFQGLPALQAQRFGQVSSGARKSSRQRSHTLSPTSAGGGGGMTGDFLGVYDVPASPAVPVSSPSSPVASPAQPGRGGASCTFTIASADSASEPGSAGLWKGSAPPKSPPKAATEDATPAVLSPERVGTVRRLSRGIEAHTPPRKARPVIEAASPVVKRSLSLQSPNSPVPKGARTAWRDGDPTSPGSGAGGPSTPPSVSPAKRCVASDSCRSM